jgi:hypothetical protein
MLLKCNAFLRILGIPLVSVLILVISTGASYIYENVIGSARFHHSNVSEWWEIKNISNGFMSFTYGRIYSVYLRKLSRLDNRQLHSCYDFKITDHYGSIVDEDSFCYPLIIIAGVHGCLTASLSSLLAAYPHTRMISTMHNQVSSETAESLPTIVEWLHFLPSFIESDQILIGRFMNNKQNAKMHRILRDPNTFYLVCVGIFNLSCIYCKFYVRAFSSCVDPHSGL